MTVKHGYYSAEAARQHGSSFWRAASGNEVEITSTADGTTFAHYSWRDRVYRGIVVEWVRKGRNPDPHRSSPSIADPPP